MVAAVSLQLYRKDADGRALVVAVACPIDRAPRCEVEFYGDVVAETFRAVVHATDVHVTMTHVTVCSLVPDEESDVDAYRSRLTSSLRSALGAYLYKRSKMGRAPGT